MKNSNVCESPIACDTSFITDAEYGVKRSCEFSMQQFHNDLIASPDNGGLLGARHADTNDVIISDIMLHYLAPPRLRPMTDHSKMMFGCSIRNT